MKANRKFIKGEEAVSAVIGVILMVAITVAIAATVYVYVSGMIGSAPTTTPSIQFTKDNAAKTLTVAQADPSNLNWGDFRIINETGTYWVDAPFTSTLDNSSVGAGDELDFSGHTGAQTIRIRYEPTNTLVGTWDFTA